MSESEPIIREGSPADLRAAFEIYERHMLTTARAMGVQPTGAGLRENDFERDWSLERPLVEFLASQDGARFWVCEVDDELVGFARVVPFGRIEHLTELAVHPEHQGRGIARKLVSRCWPGPPSRDVGRLALVAGSGADLSLYISLGTMPVAGQWSLDQPTERYLALRSHEIDRVEAAVHQLGAARAVDAWQRLEPEAIGHDRAHLHEFFGRERTCLAAIGEDAHASALCWVSPTGEIGPAVAERAQDLLPVVLAALDRVAQTQEPDRLGLFCTTDSWWLLRRLSALGFRVSWPGWVMCSEPLPGLDRYLPTRPVLVL